MLDQAALIRALRAAGKVRVLAIMDAARADRTAALALPNWRIETVLSPGTHTIEWIKAIASALEGDDLVYFSANPVADRGLEESEFKLRELVPLWELLWGWHGKDRIPSVHPFAVAAAVMIWLSEHPSYGPEFFYVVHFLTPHYPYIGDPPMDTTRWRDSEGHARTPEFAFMLDANWDKHEKDVTDNAALLNMYKWAYDGNLRMTLDAVQYLATILRMPLIATADHGELLGEDGKIGHGDPHPILREVPWVLVEPERMGDSVQRKLEALGYV